MRIYHTIWPREPNNQNNFTTKYFNLFTSSLDLRTDQQIWTYAHIINHAQSRLIGSDNSLHSAESVGRMTKKANFKKWPNLRQVWSEWYVLPLRRKKNSHAPSPVAVHLYSSYKSDTTPSHPTAYGIITSDINEASQVYIYQNHTIHYQKTALPQYMQEKQN